MDQFSYIVVGLGNPGPEYEETRHNIGWVVLDHLCDGFGFSEWRNDKGARAFLAQGEIAGKRCLFAKPQTFMNNSGESVASLVAKYPEAILVVVHDELDLPFGVVKVSQASGSAGHKGVQSIIDILKTNDFARIRVGIAPVDSADEPGAYRESAETFVLKPFKEEEKETLRGAVAQATELFVNRVL